MDCRTAATEQDDVSNRFLIRPGGNKEAPQCRGCPGDGNNIPGVQHIIAVRDLIMPVSFNAADQHFLAQPAGKMLQGNPGKAAAFLNPEGYDLLLAVREGLHACCGRKLKHPRDLLRHDVIRVKGKGQIHGFLQQFQIFHILRVAEDRNGVICPEFFGKTAGQQIGLVESGRGNKHVGGAGFGLGQGFQRGAVPAAADHVQAVYRILQAVLTLIDYGNVMSLLAHLAGNGHSDLPGAGYHDFHLPPEPFPAADCAAVLKQIPLIPDSLCHSLF